MSSSSYYTPNMAASTGNAKALVGAIFLQYLCYAIFYIGDEVANLAPSQYRELKSEDGSKNSGPAQAVNASPEFKGQPSK